MRYFAGADPTSVQSVKHELASPEVDRMTTATFELPGSVTSTIICDLGVPPTLGIIPSIPTPTALIKCEKGEIKIFNYVLPSIYHYITVKGPKSRVEKAYTFPDLGEPWWSTYRYQLEAFVSKVKGRTPHTWVSKEDSIANMEVIESVYAKVRFLYISSTSNLTYVKSGLGSRPKSDYIPPSSD